MSILDNIKEGIQGHFDKKKQQREMMEQLQVEAAIEKQKLFKEKFKENAFEVAKAQAYKEAAEKSGLQKLRATNRARRLSENNIAPGTFFEKLSEYTKKNIAKREENLERTKLMRETAENMKKATEQKRATERGQRIQDKPFASKQSSWKM